MCVNIYKNNLPIYSIRTSRKKFTIKIIHSVAHATIHTKSHSIRTRNRKKLNITKKLNPPQPLIETKSNRKKYETN